MQGSVYEQLQWAIQALGVEAYWTNKLNPLEMKYINGNKIVFRGADKPKKSNPPSSVRAIVSMCGLKR